MDLLATVAHTFLTTPRLARAPIALYRRGLGFVFGERLLMLEHRGRVSGEPRQVVLEVVGHPSANVLVVASGFGPTAQWYQNLQHEPKCRVSIGWRRDSPALARMMDPDEARGVLARYQQEHPQAWKRLRSAIEQSIGRPVTELPLVELTKQWSPGRTTAMADD
ncbi:nitroreductase family deazaflavin-dependent oxidoreductase [Granulicoccus phenolivorans]|uniref:nitroreductase family deazaflavin-dependent oxidoreductase n=1 Tax=Granulicoccus phenolivorans TaxID=266854 RepID=UPI000412198A|nr:nitroreductase family deazaflavin-dependent oxidoreductase [Granulicoccus phenolivorans]